MKVGMTFFEFGGDKGIARAAAELCLRFAEKGHEVHFHCAQLPMQTLDQRIQFHKVRALNSFGVLGLASFAYAGGKSLTRGSYDITHSHGNIIGADIITAHSCHKAAMEVAKTHAGREPLSNWGIADAFRLFLERKNYGERRCKKVIAVSSGVKRELMERYGLRESDVCVIPNGVDTQRFHPALRNMSGVNVRERLGIRSDEVGVLFVANEFGRKGLAYCIDALAAASCPKLKLIVVGNDRSDPYQVQARKRGVLDQVVFCGAVERIEEYYAACDLFLLPTFYEAFSLATLEAAASGLPLLITKVNGSEEFVREGENGFFIHRDPEDIAEHLNRLVEDEQLKAALSTNARRTAEAYSWDEIADRTLQLYDELRHA